jgi:hypothetical protein
MIGSFAYKQELVDSMKVTFEAITFAEVDEVSADAFRKNVFYTAFSRSYWSQMAVVSPKFNVQISMYVIPNLVETLFANAYGGREFSADEKEVKMKDLVGELLNIFGGYFMQKIQSVSGDFKLGFPQNSKGFKELPDDSAIVYYLIEDMYPLIVTIAPIT